VSRFLLAGLGNPGPAYQDTRHNAGFMVLDRLAGEEGLSWRSRDEAAWADWREGYLLKPLTMMNLSGKAVAPVVRKKGLEASQILVVYDDLDLPLGKIRIRPGGSSGGHRGVASIIEHLGTADFPRLKIGIGRPPGETISYVLGSFSPAEREILASVIPAATQAIRIWLEQGLEAAQRTCNGLDFRTNE
jgi:PTH1 family peptidyl-tRNA hydrolase